MFIAEIPGPGQGSVSENKQPSVKSESQPALHGARPAAGPWETAPPGHCPSLTPSSPVQGGPFLLASQSTAQSSLSPRVALAKLGESVLRYKERGTHPWCKNKTSELGERPAFPDPTALAPGPGHPELQETHLCCLSQADRCSSSDGSPGGPRLSRPSSRRLAVSTGGPGSVVGGGGARRRGHRENRTVRALVPLLGLGEGATAEGPPALPNPPPKPAAPPLGPPSAPQPSLTQHSRVLED